LTAAVAFLAFFVIALVVVSRAVVIVRQAEVYIIERLGRFHKKLESGLHVIIPFFDSVRAKVDLREQVVDYPKQPMITKDNVRVHIDAVIYYQIMDPIKAVYEIANLRRGIELLTMTNLRNIVGELTLDEVLVSREVMNEKLRQVLDEATDKWGVRINRVEIKDIEPPADVVETMQKQMAAEREKRAKILIAEGNKQSQILEAEGHRQAQILRAEGEAQAILRVQ
jgi:regulator of protease activity HflC (stomatin/prohibitin superfamily)